MPQVFKRRWETKGGKLRTSDFYYARFQVNGKDYVRSTGAATKKAAEKKMGEMITELREGSGVEQYLKKLKNALKELPPEEQAVIRRDAANSLLSGIDRKLALGDAWQAWLDNPAKRNPGEKTLEGYAGQWKRFKKWAEKKGVEYLHEIDSFRTQEYAADLWGSGVSPRTYNAHVQFLRSLFRILRITASIEQNPWHEVAKMEAATEGRRNLTPDELQVVCSKARGTLRYLFALGLYTGMRLGDCVCLQWDSVDFKAGVITHIPRKTRRKKKQVRIPVHPVLSALLYELRETSRGKYLFPTERKEYLRDGVAISKRIQSHFKDTCQIETSEILEEGQRKNAVCRVGFHSMRHSFISLCAANRVPQVAVMELVGHGSPAMTALYSHAGDEQKLKAITALPSISFETEDGTEE